MSSSMVSTVTTNIFLVIYKSEDSLQAAAMTVFSAGGVAFMSSRTVAPDLRKVRVVCGVSFVAFSVPVFPSIVVEKKIWASSYVESFLTRIPLMIGFSCSFKQSQPEASEWQLYIPN